MEPKPSNPQDGRLHQALLDYIRQEFETAVGGILGCAEIMIDGAEQQGGHSTVNDLRRLHQAGLTLKNVAEGLHHPVPIDQDFADFGRQLRHDLRSPIGVIKGLAEMLLEDTEEVGDKAQSGDLRMLIDATVELLARVDTLVDFPLTSRPVATSARPAPEPADTDLEPPLGASADAASSRILVVDDEEGTREVLARRLVRAGHRVAEAESGQSALERIMTEPFDLILLDMMMPDINGYELLKQFKADARYRHIPVIVISALDEIDAVVRCIEAGAEDYLSKPFNPILLQARIGASLEKKQLRDREKALQDSIAASLLAHEKRLQEAYAAIRPEIAQLQETIVRLRRQLDAAASGAKAGVEEARATAAAEIHQLRATCQALRQRLDAAIAERDAGADVSTVLLRQRGTYSPERQEEQADDGR